MNDFTDTNFSTGNPEHEAQIRKALNRWRRRVIDNTAGQHRMTRPEAIDELVTLLTVVLMDGVPAFSGDVLGAIAAVMKDVFLIRGWRHLSAVDFSPLEDYSE